MTLTDMGLMSALAHTKVENSSMSDEDKGYVHDVIGKFYACLEKSWCDMITISNTIGKLSNKESPIIKLSETIRDTDRKSVV